MAPFLLTLAVAVVINLVTALFNRKHGLQLLPWLLLFIGIHGLTVLLNNGPVKMVAMEIAHKNSPWKTYPVVLICASILAGLYWWGINTAVHKLDSATQTQPPPSTPPPGVESVLEILFTQSKNILHGADGTMSVTVGVRKVGPKSILDVSLIVESIKVLSIEPEQPNSASEQVARGLAANFIDAPLMIKNNLEVPPRKAINLDSDTQVVFSAFVAQRGPNSRVIIQHALRVQRSIPGGQIFWQSPLPNNDRLPPGRYRILLRAQGRDVEPKRIAFDVKATSNELSVTPELQPSAHPELTPAVTIAPESVTFNVPFPNDTYTFTITNTSDLDKYIIGFKFRVHSDQLSGDDFAVGLATGSRKPLGDAAPGFADVSGFRALDKQDRPLFYLQIHRLAAHDRREITITRRKLGLATITAESDYSTVTPQPIVMHDNQIGGPLRVNEEMRIISPIAFNSESSTKDIGANPRQQAR